MAPKQNEINEKTNLSLSLPMAWSVLVSCIAAAVWITLLVSNVNTRMEQLYTTNQREHVELMNLISIQKMEHLNFVRKNTVVDVAVILDRRRTNYLSTIEEMDLRRQIRDTIE